MNNGFMIIIQPSPPTLYYIPRVQWSNHMMTFAAMMSSGHGNPMIVYLLPFVVGWLMGCMFIIVGCWGELWMCQKEDATDGALLQVEPPAPQMIAFDNKLGSRGVVNSPTNFTHSLKVTEMREQVSSELGCPNRPFNILILILSAPTSYLRRMAIRGTWLHDYKLKIVNATTKFLVGLQQLDEETVKNLKEEQRTNGDLILLPGLKDSYSNLSTKVLLGLQWAHKNTEFDFLVKADDDSYVRIESISNALREMNCENRLYWGYFMGYAYPEATGKWAELNWFHCPHYFPYAMGGGYVISRKVVNILMQFPTRLTLYNNEDVTVASWLAPYHLNRKHDVRFDVESISHGCNNNYLISHKQRVRSLYLKYTSLIKNGTLCPEEREIRPAYVYNWTALPLSCCTRIHNLHIT